MTKLFTQDGATKREFTEAEYAQHELDQATNEATANAIAKAKADKALLLVKLGITNDEAKLLLL
jgi:hypothetical protein